MNRFHRVIWSEHTGAWVAVAETTRGRGKGSGRAARRAMLAAMLSAQLAATAPALAQTPATTVVPTSNKTTAYISANGVPVVDIATANSAGLSHNVFNRYDVNANGLVLNNGNLSQLTRQSQLAGQVAANAKLSKEAKIILNEVVAPNRSVLAGFTEVLGGKADVIVANPYGITCSGCGFINTDRVTLTTGKSNINIDGSLAGFSVSDGSVIIGGAGAMASTQQIFDIVARSVLIDGKLNTMGSGSVGITAGANTWDYASRNVTGSSAASGAAPSYAVDSTLLGGMYAGRIRIVATEAGVGVRMLGEAAASADDFTLTSVGKIELQAAVSAARDAAISTTSASAKGDLTMGAAARLSAARDLSLTAAAGQISLTDGELYAANNLAVAAALLDDTSAKAGTRFGGGANTIATTGAARIGGSIWGAGKNLTGNFDSLAVTAAGTKLYAGTTLALGSAGELALADAAVRATGDLSLTAKTGALSTAVGTGQGIQSTDGNLLLSGAKSVSHAGAASADRGSATVRTDGAFSNTGTVHGATALTVAGGSVSNTGMLITEAQLSATTGKLTNSGQLQAKDKLSLQLSGDLANSGTLLAGTDLAIDAGTAAVALSNTGSGVIQAGKALTIEAAKASFATQAGTVLGNSAALNLARLNNSGTLQSNSQLSMLVGQELVNSGTVLAKTALTSQSASLDNAGVLQAGGGSTIAVTGALVNTGKLIASGSAANGASLSAGTLVNGADAVIQSDNMLVLDLSGATLNNAGTILAKDSLAVTSRGAALTLDNVGSAYLQAGKTLTLGGKATVLNNSASILADQLLLDVSSLDNSGAMQGGTSASIITATGDVTNSGKLTLARTGAGNGAITARNLTNSGTLQSAADMNLNVTSLISNSGTLYAAGSLMSSSGRLTNTGTLQAERGSGIVATGALVNYGLLIGSASAGYGATLQGTSLENGIDGVIQSAQNLALTLTGGPLENGGRLLAVKDMTVTSGGPSMALTNLKGAYVQAGGMLTLGGNAVTFDNKAGANLLADELALTLASLGNDGLIQGGAKGSTVKITNGARNAGVLTLSTGSAGKGSLTATSLTNAGTLQSAGNAGLTITKALDNAGTLLTDGTLATSSATLTNSGTLQAVQGSTIAATGALVNTGTLIGSATAGKDAILSGSTLNNQNNAVMQSAGTLDIRLTGGTLDNAGDLLAASDLKLYSSAASLAVHNFADAYMQAGAVLNINNNAAALSNDAQGTMLANRLVLNLDSLTNNGNLQGGAGASTLEVGGNVTNNGTLTLATSAAGNGTISAAAVTNTGILQSKGGAALNVTTALTNSGDLLAVKDLSVRGTAGSYNVVNTGQLEAGNKLSIKGSSDSNLVTISNGMTAPLAGAGVATLLGGSVDVSAQTLSMGNGATLSSMGTMDLMLDSLAMSGTSDGTVNGTSTAIVAAKSGTDTATITLANAYSNQSAIHSGGNLTFIAPNITNSATGGFSALKTLTMTAAGGTILNNGALYAGEQLTASALTITNTGASGNIDSSGHIDLTATFLTNNHSIDATGNITIKATNFTNELPGGDQRVWGADTTAAGGEIGHDSQGYNGHGCCDQYEVWYYRYTWHRIQRYANLPQYATSITSGANLSISDMLTGVNRGAILSANNVTITGLYPGASFVNDALPLSRIDTTQTYRREIKYKAAGPLEYYDQNYLDLAITPVSSALPSMSAGIYATNEVKFDGTKLDLMAAQTAPSPTKGEATSNGATSLNGAVSGTQPSGLGALAPAQGGAGTTSGTTLGSTGSGTVPALGVTGVNGKPAISFGGLVVALPSNPNGYFVPSKSADAKYLIETNPLFAVGNKFLGSDYLEERYGYNPDVVIKRLGDANYEAYLIRQQLMSQTGNNLLKGYGNEANQVKQLMDQAVSTGKQSGFVFGKALTATQIANLDTDLVWMVETTVAGQKVLAPVVYLAASTRLAIETGSVIAGDHVTMDLASLTNNGGTISGAKSLTITSKGDVVNSSGTIKGGDVAVKSTDGSIVNQTTSQASGTDQRFVTTIGKTAGIVATGTLALDAKKDISVKGANVSAGGDASLAAGGNITFDTIVDKNTDTTHSTSGNGLSSSRTITTTTTEKNIGSTLTTGGNLTLKSGGDTTIAGSTVDAAGNLDVDAGGSLNVLARQDKTTTHTESNSSGMGVGGGVIGASKTTTDDFKGTNKGSSLTAGGNATVKAGKDIVIQGSDVAVAGDADLNAKNGIKILDGLDEQRTTSKTETTTFLKMDNAGEKQSASGSASASAAVGKPLNFNASASASAEASAGASGTSDLKLSESTTTTTQSGSKTSVASNLKVGGNLAMKTDGTVTVQGSNVEAGGDLAIDAKKVDVLTGRNEEWSNTQTTQTSTGIYNEGSAEAKAGAKADARAGSAATVATADASAKAEASGTTTIGARTSQEDTTSYKLTNSSSVLKSGGNLSIKAKEDATFVGANVESGGDMKIEAKNIKNLAAQDIETSTSSKTTHTAGVYLDAGASAEAKASADAGKIAIGGKPANASAGVEASADASAGVRYKNEKEASEERSVTQVTSSFKAGGNLTRTASDTITDQGTQIEAGGSINQTAREIKEIAATNSTFSSSDSSSHDAKIGVGAGASASAGASSNDGASAEAGAGAGIRAKYAGTIDGESASTTTAVTTKYKAGTSINSTSTEKTTLIGTQFEAGGDVNLNAGSLDFQAARDTASSSKKSQEINAELKVDVIGKAGVSASADYANKGESESSSTARAGGVNAGGNLNIKTGGDARFEGTALEAGGKADIAAGGNVSFVAARDTTESKSTSIEANAGFSSSKKGGKAVELGGAYAQEDGSSSTAQVATIKAGSGGINVSAGKDASFEGTKLTSGGDTAIGAGGNVNLMAAKNTEKTVSFGVDASVGASKSTEGSAKEGGIGGSVGYANKVESAGTALSSAGKTTISGKTVANQEAKIDAAGGKQITGKVVNSKAENSDVSVGFAASAAASKEKKAPLAGSKTTDDIPGTKAPVDTTPRSKTTDDLPAKSAPSKATTPAEKAAERKAIIDGLKADKVKLDTPATAKKAEPAAKPASAAAPAVKADTAAKPPAPSAPAAKPATATAAATPAAPAPAPAKKDPVAERKAIMDKLRADQAKLDKKLKSQD